MSISSISSASSKILVLSIVVLLELGGLFTFSFKDLIPIIKLIPRVNPRTKAAKIKETGSKKG
jgi:hypothetical protein